MKRRIKNRQILLGTVIALSIILVLLIMLLFWMNNMDAVHNSGVGADQLDRLPEDSVGIPKETETPEEQTTQPLEETTQPPEETTLPQEENTRPEPPVKVPEVTEPVYEDVEVQTTYCKLFYSGQWADSIRTERITRDFTETILFYGTAEGKEAVLFAVYFAGTTDNSYPVGVYSTVDGLMVDISAEIFELEAGGWTDTGFDQICAMQEQVNYVIEKLEGIIHKEPVIQLPEATEPVCEDVDVQTTYCKLYYSGQWAGSIRTEHILGDFTETVLFYGTAEGKETALFAVYFADATDNSFPVGAYLATDDLMVDISIEIFELENTGWTNNGFYQICTMQEQVNYLIEKLLETEGFTPVQ